MAIHTPDDDMSAILGHVKLPHYLAGLGISIACTAAAFLLVVSRSLGGLALGLTICGIAFVQFVGQLIFFLHMRDEEAPRWRLAVFLVMCLIVFIFISGSLWIMHSLHVRMSIPLQEKYMQSQSGI